MFHKLRTLALVAPLASALVLHIPENPTSGGQNNLTWINEPNDPVTWDLGLVNGPLGKAFHVVKNVDPSAGSLTLTLPIVPVGSDYALLAFVADDFNKNFTTSSLFSIGPATTSTGSGSSTAPSATRTPFQSGGEGPNGGEGPATSSSTTSSSTTSSSTTSSLMTSSSTTSSSTNSSSTTSSSTTPSFAGSSLIPQASFTGNGITATPSSSSISSDGLTSGDIAALASSISIGVLGLILAIISVWYARKQALAGKPVFRTLRDEMARFRHTT